IPRMAIPRCLEQRHAELTAVQLAACLPRAALSDLREDGFRLRTLFSGSRAAWAHALGRDFREVAQVRQIRRLYGATSFVFLDHHLCHAASAYFTSPFERALVLTLDERGDMRSGSLYLGDGDELRLLRPLR